MCVAQFLSRQAGLFWASPLAYHEVHLKQNGHMLTNAGMHSAANAGCVPRILPFLEASMEGHFGQALAASQQGQHQLSQLHGAVVTAALGGLNVFVLWTALHLGLCLPTCTVFTPSVSKLHSRCVDEHSIHLKPLFKLCRHAVSEAEGQLFGTIQHVMVDSLH